MSKIFKGIASFFKAIYKFFDKIFITPISKLIYKIGKLLNKNNGKLEKFLKKNYKKWKRHHDLTNPNKKQFEKCCSDWKLYNDNAKAFVEMFFKSK